MVQVQQVPLVLSINATEQRVSGGRLFIQNARNLRTKVMSNGVEVIVRGEELHLQLRFPSVHILSDFDQISVNESLI